MTVSKHIPKDIKRVSRSIGYALWIGTTQQWFGLPAILRARLSNHERASLAFQVLKSLDQDLAAMTANLVLSGSSCGLTTAPVAPLFDCFDEAATWVANTDPDELDTYLVAIFEVMPSSKKQAFLDYAGRAAA